MNVKNMQHLAAGKQRGVTLIELLVVLVIISVLAAMVVPQFFGQADEARVKVAKADVANIRNAVEIYRLNNGSYPTSLQEIAGVGKSLRKLPKDPWGKDYHYQVNANAFTLYSTGADGVEGGSGVDEDIKDE